MTARHVLRGDDAAAFRRINETYRRGQEAAKTPSELTPSERESFERDVFGIVFRVPGLDEARHGSPSSDRPFLMNLGAGVPSLTPYTYSPPYLDLAVISLRGRGGMDHDFADSLVAAGISPIAISDIGDGPSTEGAEVFTAGYPEAVSPQRDFELELPTALAMWQSSKVSLPNFSFGRVSLLHQDLPFFWTDLSVYPGNSGGPVIEDDRLVGVVSAQAFVRVEFEETLAKAGLGGFARIPFGRIAKGIHIKALLKQQAEKERAWPV